MNVSAHGIAIDAPSGWEARIFRRRDGAPVMHLATFALQEDDGDFGAAATGRMRGDDAFAALVEYRADTTVRAGTGLFADIRRPRFRAIDFAAAQLQVTRPGQLGCQRFFTDAGRPFCLYAVMRPAHKPAERLADQLGAALATLTVSA